MKTLLPFHVLLKTKNQMENHILNIVLMPLTISIAQGLAFGFISYTVLKLLTGKRNQIHWIMYFVSIAFIINFIMGGH
ncbi:hypothetical protein ACIQXV_21060 [Neobacillus sp. NPDC097160]|uniref:hypothetical protein n=1 Tax=Neobacillus sp. NPDC097160 TaxID=3364298 RepID=UPI003817EF85